MQVIITLQEILTKNAFVIHLNALRNKHFATVSTTNMMLVATV